MNTERLKRKLTTVFSADAVGYSRLMGMDEAATVRTIELYRGVRLDLIGRHGGRVVDTVGDNLLAEFASVVEAVQCSVAVQKALSARNAELPSERRMEFRIGINLGDIVEKDGRLYGDGVNIAARLEGLADAGGICISGSAYDQVENKLDLVYIYLGEQSVKNIPRPVRTYRVVFTTDAHFPAQDLLELEREYRQRIKARYAEDAAYYVPLAGESGELNARQSIKATRSAHRRRYRAAAEYHEWIRCGQDIRRVKLKTLKEAVDRYSCVILLGEPGCGKTTALQNLAYQFCDNPDRLPLLLHLSAFEPGMSIEEFIVEGWGGSSQSGHWGSPALATHLQRYLEKGKLFFMLDALNEMPQAGYRESSSALRRFIERWSVRGNRFLVSCRRLDYGEELSGLQRVEVMPLTSDKIRQFLQNELPERWQSLWQILEKDEKNRRPLLEMARNPYLLTVMVDVFEKDQNLGRNRSELMVKFSRILLDWAKAKCPPDRWLDADILHESLSVAAFEMQVRSGFGTRVKTAQVRSIMPREVQLDPNWPPRPAPPDRVLSLAAGANIVEMPIDRSSVRFYHQLLQEYFAACRMLKKDPADLSEHWRWAWSEAEMPLWPRSANNHEPLPPPPTTGWEETTILAVKGPES
jgi:class 3 adenylate cyclase